MIIAVNRLSFISNTQSWKISETQNLFSNILFLFLTKLENVQVTQVYSVCVCVCACLQNTQLEAFMGALSAANLSWSPAATFIN